MRYFLVLAVVFLLYILTEASPKTCENFASCFPGGICTAGNGGTEKYCRCLSPLALSQLPCFNGPFSCQCKPNGECNCNQYDGWGRGTCTDSCAKFPIDCPCPGGTYCLSMQGGKGTCQPLPFPGNVCGSGDCNVGIKNCNTCPEECGCKEGFVCKTSGPNFLISNYSCVNKKNDGVCNLFGGETCESNPDECSCGPLFKCVNSECENSCGDGICQLESPSWESAQNCPQDCKVPPPISFDDIQ